MAERRNPLDVTGFKTKPPSSTNRPSPEAVEQIAQDVGFPSRDPASKAAHEQKLSQIPKAPTVVQQPVPLEPPRDNRRRTGRNVQKNFKITAEAVTLLEQEALRSKETFGEILERGLAAIQRLRDLKVDDYY
jgi:hypothetical protein